VSQPVWVRLPALLLVCVALHQLWLVKHAALSAWSGGAFGMFSTIDGWGARHLHARARSPSILQEVAIPPELRDDLRRTLALPSDARLADFARALAPHVPRDLEPPETLRIEVFTRRYHPETLAPGGEPLRALELPLGAGELLPLDAER
jgi:hypothetical protein